MKRIAELFERARELDAAARPALLARECHGDEGLRKAVEQLLSASAEAENCPIWQASAMDSEARMLAAESYGPANRLQRYQLLELLGAGGMGMVYAAVRADDSYDKKVATRSCSAAWAMRPSSASSARSGRFLPLFSIRTLLTCSMEAPATLVPTSSSNTYRECASTSIAT